MEREISKIRFHASIGAGPDECRPYAIRLAQAMCDHGLTIDEAIVELNEEGYSASRSRFLDQHAITISYLVRQYGRLHVETPVSQTICWIPTPGGVFRYDAPPPSGAIYNDSFSKSFSPAIDQEFHERSQSLISHLGEYLGD